MIATIYILFLIFGMASCFAAIVVAADDWVDRRHDRVHVPQCEACADLAVVVDAYNRSIGFESDHVPMCKPCWEDR